MTVTIIELAKRLGATVVGAPASLESRIAGIKPIEAAGEEDVTFVADAKHQAAVAGSRAAAVIVAKPIDKLPKPQLLVKDVSAALIEALNLFAPKLKPARRGGGSVRPDRVGGPTGGRGQRRARSW